MNITQQRLQNQHLLEPTPDSADNVVRWLGAMQSQDYAGAKWAIAQRCIGVSDRDLDLLFNDGRILRTHVMRPTWHFVTPQDIRWMLKLTSERVRRVSAYYYRKTELDERTFRRSNAAIAKALRTGVHLTRSELAEILQKAGINASGMRLAYLVMRAELDAVICSGALRGKQFTYALLEQRVPPVKELHREEALAELTRRYFTSHGPALLQDFAWWSGLTVADARMGVDMAGIGNESLKGKTYWFAASSMPVPKRGQGIYLLPNYDEYLVAYKDHDPSFDPSLLEGDRGNRSAVMVHLIVLKGQVIGGWQRTIDKTVVTIRTRLLVTLGRRERAALDEACQRYGMFLGKAVKLA